MIREGYKGFYVNGYEDWSQFFEACNWRTFHFVMFEIEDDRMLGGIEMTVFLLGLGFRLRWNYAETEDVRELKRRVEEVKDIVDGE